MEMQEFHKQSTLPNLTSGQPEPIGTPQKIGPYKIETLLSKGGMSYLYLGMHPEKNMPLVVKVLSPRYMTHPEMVQQFLKEAEIIALTDHPNIIKLYGQGEWESGLYIAMEFVQGISLKQFIMQQNLSIRSSLEIVLQVAYALLHLHTHGVIHRDLKPENILITENGQIKVIDFGIAQLHADGEKSPLGRKGQFLGTPSYMSPEQKKDPLNVTYATDIYALGVIAFELIVGKLSYGSIQLSLLPERLQKIVEKALQPLLENRYQDVVDFITDISHFLKENAGQREVHGGHDVKEVWEVLEESHRSLLPKSTPKWSHFDIGFATPPDSYLLSLFYDFMRLADQSYLTLIGQYHENQIQALTYTGMLKGMVQTLTQEFLTSSEKKFNPIEFMTSLNEMLGNQDNKPQFSFHLFHLCPLEDQFSFISCDFPAVLHLPAGKTEPRFLSNDNPCLGADPQHGFYETTENWTEGDTLILHTFREKAGDLESEISKILPHHLQLSAQSQAEGILNDLSKTFPGADTRNVLCIQRIT